MTTKIKAGVIGDGVVGTTQIADDAITSAKLDTNIAVAGTLTVTGDANFDSNTLFVDASANSVGIGTTSPNSDTTLTISAANNQIDLISTDNSEASINFVNSGGISRQGFIKYEHDGDYSGNMQFRVAGSERVRIDSSGRVGITVVPETDWHVDRPPLQIGNNGSISSKSISTNAQMSVNANAKQISSSNATGWKYIDSEYASQHFQFNGEHQFRVAPSGTADAAITWTNAMVIDNSGNVGIGTTTPVTALEISTDGADHLTLNRADASININNVLGGIVVSADDPTENRSGAKIGFTAADNWTTNYFPTNIIFSNDAAGTMTPRMTIDNSGNVGIGTASPYGLTHWEKSSTVNLVATNTGADGQADTTVMSLIGQARGYSNNLSKLASIDFKTDPTTWYYGAITFNVANLDGTDTSRTPLEAMRINRLGNVLMGAPSNASGQRLHIESAAQFGQIGLRHSSAASGKFWYIGPASNNTFAIYNQTPAGVYLADGATSWTGASDESLKENIVELTGALDKVKDYRCVEYNLISDETNSKKIGFIAQDWQEDYSQVVSQDSDGNLGMQYTETIPVLLKAIQEQQTLIDDLKSRLDSAGL